MLNLRMVIAFAIACLGSLPVLSQSFASRGVYTAEELVDIRIASVKSEGLMFALSAMAAPLCPKDRLVWSAGPQWLRVWPEATTASRLREQGSALKKRFAVADDDRVFVATQVLTPHAQAGILAGDVVSAESSGPIVPFEPRDTLRARTLAAYEANPVRVFGLTRGSAKLEVEVNFRLTCIADLIVKKSQRMYADSSKVWGVIITEPLIKTLSYRQQAVVFAHEMAQLATGGINANDGTRALVGSLLFGGLSAIGSNPETRYHQPSPGEMQEADAVALWLLAPLSISPEEYLNEIALLNTEPSGVFTPTYANTRSMSEQRRTTLESWVKTWKEDGSLPMPKSYSEATMQQFKTQALRTGLVSGVTALIAEGQQAAK